MKRKSFGKWIISYLRQRLRAIILFLLFAGIFIGVFALYRYPLDGIIYGCLLCGTLGSAYLILDICRFYRLHRQLQTAAETITDTLGQLPETVRPIEQDYQKLLRLLFESQSRILSEAETAKGQLSDYYALWVHQIKVPISAIHLLLAGDEKNAPLKIELFKIEQYVEMALSYVRLESGATDYVFKEYALEDIVKQAVRKYAPLFIAKKIRLDIAPIATRVVTDEKWLLFVIEQILSNSLKYTKTGVISIYETSPDTLVIEDTGIGIAPEDIKRIGEKGFTGYNGRADKKSTGLGLYLCKEILGRLSHTMAIQSEPGKGTQVFLHLGRRDMLME